ncbi:autotransporter outer membrane beta-barrel domain-containing protein [Amphritea sp. 1_MG-2023]|uniref:autotransporter family protein n=1 Tax=Amphritea sp. 1_MG-2023 TaxID=3062670 RepID=UPI0026E3D01A|nr:autotransporter outer membrane beta-barrel domain-containing protein [Amphritea sp. 1_MG-2023]MDO6562237.1 autotransporter outer membrane beta-barrel domain-containing protein [Amphritea sp. 1_MG-2023]
MERIAEYKNVCKKMKFFRRSSLAVAILMGSGSLMASTGSITLTGDYIKIGTNAYGTLGSIGNIAPGIQYDATGSGTFNDSYDYLTPGSPFEGYYFTVDANGSTYTSGANNARGMSSGVSSDSLVDISTDTYNGVEWIGSYDPGTGTLFDITNTVGFDDADKQVKITTTITATEDLSNLYLLRVIDPDTVAASGDWSYTTNVRGSEGVAETNFVYAEALVSKYIIGLYSTATSDVNTGISRGWSSNPLEYYAGLNDGDGDYTIGIAFNQATLVADDTVTFTYYYVFGSDIAAVVEETISGLSVAEATQLLNNTPAYGAATVVDSTPELLALFSGAGLSGDTEVSAAASEVLPLLSGSSVIATTSSLTAIQNTIQSRISANTGMSSGEGFLGDKYVWMKPFGSWADQREQGGVEGYDAETVGMVLGLDGSLNERTRLGLAFAFAESNIDAGTSAAPQSLDLDIYQLTTYGSYTLAENMEADFQVAYGQNKTDASRDIAFTNTVASSSYDSESFQAGVGLSRLYPYKEGTDFIASARLDYTHLENDAYSESGAGLLNLNVEKSAYEALIVGVDGKLAYQLGNGRTLETNLGLGYDIKDQGIITTAAFDGAPTVSFDTNGLKQDPWIVDIGIGYNHQAQNGMQVSLRYDVQGREDYLNQSASVKMQWAF